MNDLTLVYSTYNNPETLEFQVRLWQSYPQPIRDAIKIIVVDDCSPTPVLPILINSGLNLKLFRINKDIPWNITGAKNLGANQADSKWIFISDIDHFFTPDNLQKVLETTLNEDNYYNFNRARVGDTELDSRKLQYRWPSNNIIMLTKKAFWKAGGYDEDFAGCYGCEGGYLGRCLKTTGLKQTVFDVKHNVWPEQYEIGVVLNYFCSSKFMVDSKTPNLSRDKTRNLELFKKKQRKIIPQSTDHLRFKWEQLT